MTFFTLVLIAVIILAIIGLGWNTFVVAVLEGFDKTLDVGIPIIKNLTQEVQGPQAQAQTQNQTSEPGPGPEAPSSERGNEDCDPTTAKMGYA
jgi:hypothetical protein